MNLEHNHELTFNAKDAFSKEVIDRINTCKGKTKTLVDLKDLINKEFKAAFVIIKLTIKCTN